MKKLFLWITKKISKKSIARKFNIYIEAHYRDVDIGQTGVADIFKMSSYTLSKMFKKQVGVGFTEYINSKRIEYSKESYFCRVFKAAVGVSPATFREQ